MTTISAAEARLGAAESALDEAYTRVRTSPPDTDRDVALQNAQRLHGAARDLDDARVDLARAHQQAEWARLDSAREQQRALDA